MWYQHILHRIKQVWKPLHINSIGEQNGEKVQLSPQAIWSLDRLQLSASRFLTGKGVGVRLSHRRRPAYDFREHRMYIPGDDIRFVDWKASARHETIFIKQGELRKDISVYLLIDTSTSMNWGFPTKIETTRKLAAALGYLALSHGDRLYVHPIGSSKNRPLGPLSGKGQVPTLLNYLHTVSFDAKGRIDKSITQFSRRSSSGLVLILSDLLDVDNLRETLRFLPAPSWDVIIIHLLHSKELEPDVRGNFRLVDIESGAYENYDIDQKAIQAYRQHIHDWKYDLEMACVESNAFYCSIQTDLSLENEIIPTLRRLHILNEL